MADYRITVDTEVNSAELDKIESRIKNLKNQKLAVDIDVDGSKVATNISKSLKGVRGEIKVDAKVSKTSLQKLNKALSSNKYMSQMSRMQTQVGKFGATGPLTKQMSALQDAYNSLQKFSGKVVDESDFNEADAAVKRFNTELEKTKNLYSAMSSGRGMAEFANKQEQITQNFRNQRNILDKQIVAWLNNNSRAADDFGDRLDDVRLRLSQLNGNDVQGLKNLKAEFQSIKLEADALDKTGLKFGDRLKKQFNEYVSYIGVAGALATAGEGFRYMAQNVLEVDTAMTGLYRVTDLTSQQYETMFDRMISSAQKYGNTLTDTINATSDWVRAGFDENTSLDLAEITSMYQHVSDLDYSEAAENLLTAYKGFQSSFNQEFGDDAAASVEHIADVYNELDNQFAITSAGLGEGISRSASALELAGNTFEEAAA